MIIDSGLKGNDYVSFVATDNRKGGRWRGERLASRRRQGQGRAAPLRRGRDSTTKREQGFLDAMKAHPGIEVVSSNQYGGADVEGAYKKAEALLSRYKKAGRLARHRRHLLPRTSRHASAMLRVLQDNGWAGKVKFVGFDASRHLVKGLARRRHRRPRACRTRSTWATSA